MSKKTISWDEVPDIITKEQLWRLCHISKSTARFLLQSGKIPCMNTGKKTRCYKILKKDVMAYVADREELPEYYMATKGWYSRNANPPNTLNSIPEIRGDMHNYYIYLLRKHPDVLDTKTISEITGYGKTAINNWCNRNALQHFVHKGQNLVPKIYLIDFFCSPAFRTIARKSEWHVKILVAYPNWKNKRRKR